MISSYRNLGLIQAAVALGLSVWLAFLLRNHHPAPFRRNDQGALLLVIVYLTAWVMWVLASLSLTRAKGYKRDFGGALLLFFLVAGCCIPGAPIIFPFIIIFALEDKTKNSRRRR